MIYSATQYGQSTNVLKLKEIKITNYRNWKRERFHWLSGGIYLITVSRTGVLTSSLLTTKTKSNVFFQTELYGEDSSDFLLFLFLHCSFSLLVKMVTPECHWSFKSYKWHIYLLLYLNKILLQTFKIPQCLICLFLFSICWCQIPSKDYILSDCPTFFSSLLAGQDWLQVQIISNILLTKYLWV